MKGEHKDGAVEAIVAGALTAPGLDDLATEYAELGLDAIIDSDTVSEIPFIKSVVGIARMGVEIRNRLFTRKLLDFLCGFRGISDWERRDMVSRLEADSDYGRRWRALDGDVGSCRDNQKAKDGPCISSVCRAHNRRGYTTSALYRYRATASI